MSEQLKHDYLSQEEEEMDYEKIQNEQEKQKKLEDLRKQIEQEEVEILTLYKKVGQCLVLHVKNAIKSKDLMA